MNISPKISIFIVDDHPLMRQALKASILTETDMKIVGEATDGAEAVDLIPALKPDIVIMDLMMPNMGGVEAIERLKEICPEIVILVLSSLKNEESIYKSVRSGARGYLTKDVQHDELISAIRLVSAGKTYLPPEIVQKLVDGVHSDILDKISHSLALLTKREKEVFALLAKGYSNTEISKIMFVQQSTVRVYLHQIMKKMGFDNRREMVIFAIKEWGEK